MANLLTRLGRSHKAIDFVGATVSLACAVHCLLLPAILAILPLLGVAILPHSQFELIMITTAVVVALASMCWGYRVHGRPYLLLLVLLALLTFSVAHLIEGDYLHGAVMALGGIMLAAAHIINRKLCSGCSSCC